MNALSLRAVVVLSAGALCAPALVGTAWAGPAPVLYVDKGNTSCRDSGLGSAAMPFCTISKGATVAVAGQTVQVSAGTYNEAVSVANSGSAGSPITFAASPGVVVTSSSVGIAVPGRSWVVIRGFETGPTTNEGILVSGAASHVTIVGNHVHNAGTPVSGRTKNGIGIQGSTVDSTVVGNTVDHNSDSGIYLTDTSTRVLVTGNETFANARVYTRAAPGIDIRSSGNTIQGNYSHDNEDSGVQLRGSCTGNVVVGNRTDHNGDHGIDILNCTDTLVTGNSVYLNVTAGINDEGQSQRVTIKNNISADNGINSPRSSGNIRVDSASYVGSVADSNLTYLSTPSTDYKWNTTSYDSLAAFRSATGQEARGLQGDPRWRNRAAGDLHLLAGSPAIDSADSGAPFQLTTDYDGVPRSNDPATPDTGIGPRTYDDRGAYELVPSVADAPPVAALSVTPSSGAPPLAVTANASGSTDTDATPIASYAFTFGDGSAAVGPQPGATATHTYNAAGTFTVTVTVTDTARLSSTQTATVTVGGQDAPPVAALSVTPSSGLAPLAVTADASRSTDADATPIASYAFTFGDGSATVGPQAGATATHTYNAAGTFTVTVTVTDTAGLSSTKIAAVTVSSSQNLVGNPGFETATTGWAGYGTAALARTAGGHSGGWQCQVTNTGTVAGTAGINDNPNWVTNTVTGTYTATAWVRADIAGGSVNLRLKDYNGTALVSSTTKQVTLSTSWQQIVLTYTATAGHALDLQVYAPAAAPGAVYFIDDVSITVS